MIGLARLLMLAVIFSACKAQTKPNGQSLLWKISGKTLAKPSYLFGTMHMICPDDYVWTDAMKNALAASDKVCFELDLDEPGLMQQMSADMAAGDDKPLKAYFSAADYEHLKQFSRDSLELDITEMPAMKPFMLQMLFITKMLTCSFPASYEGNIMEEAHKAKKEVLGIEQLQEQLDIFKNFPDDTAAVQIMQFADSFSKMKQDFARMIASYRAQDLAALYDQTKASKELGDQLGIFLDDRNRKWIPRMSKYMPSNSVFFAVGAAHLYGEAGVIQLLRKAGYTVEPIQ